MGFEPKQEMQINFLDKTTRISLYNLMQQWIPEELQNKHVVIIWENIANKFLLLSRDEAFFPIISNVREYPKMRDDTKRKFKNIFYEEELYVIFNFIEYLDCHWLNGNARCRELINLILINENVGYRFINGMFVPLTDEGQLAELAEAMATPYQNANEHIKKATKHFSNRENPDYKNSITESINAVEFMVKKITGKKKSTLGQAIKELEVKDINLHPAFIAALNKLYGFASDTLRHPDMNEEPLEQDQATARFMLITCSAFVNYIIANAPTKK